MASIKIKDLSDSVDLDRQAMTAISGGARLRGRQGPGPQPLVRGSRLVDYPAVSHKLLAKSGKPAK